MRGRLERNHLRQKSVWLGGAKVMKRKHSNQSIENATGLEELKEEVGGKFQALPRVLEPLAKAHLQKCL